MRLPCSDLLQVLRGENLRCVRPNPSAPRITPKIAIIKTKVSIHLCLKILKILPCKAFAIG
jgi:hypothetical protein